MEIFFEIHKDLPREGPGDSISTMKAYSLLNETPKSPLLLDIGCGPGRQTQDIASQTNARVIALDIQTSFLKRLSQAARQAKHDDRIMLTNGSMFCLPFCYKSFDIIWSEGAIYISGFENSLHEWRNFLKPGGYLAVTEISWIKSNPPNEVFSYWKSEYPGIGDITKNLEISKMAGYDEFGHFTLPASSWWDNYYTPMVNRLPTLQDKYKNDPEAIKCIQATRLEIEMYEKYSEWYGYVFYILKTTS